MDNKEMQSVIRRNLSLNDRISSNVMNELTTKYCTGCSACALVCPESAVTMRTDSEGFLRPQIDNDKCIMCGICAEKCPQLNAVRQNSASPVCYAVMAEEETRMKSSSGGMFTIAASWIFEQGGVVCGAAFDEDLHVCHVLVNSMDKLSALRGSKYIQSSMDSVYTQIGKELSSGKPVLFTGVPCQVAALYSVVGRDNKNLYTIDLMCHGVSSYKVLEKYIHDTHNQKPVKELYFKRKEPWGWGAGTSIFFKDGTKYEQYHYFDPFFIAYHSGDSKNAACSCCEANTIPRQGDLTMGDFWGIDILAPDMNDYKGTSAVLINNEKGELLFKRLTPRIARYKRQPLSYALAKNAALREQNLLSTYRDVFFDHLDYVDFDMLVYGCKYYRLYDLLAADREKTVSREDMDLYLLAKAAFEKCGDRQIITWVRSPKFEKILSRFFGKRVSFGITTKIESIKENSIRLFDDISGKSYKYFLVLIQRPNDTFTEKKLLDAGYTEGKDYVSKIHLPIVIEHYDLSEGPYCDRYGNSVEGCRGIIGRIEFCGSNNRIIFGNNLKEPEKLSVTLGSNGRLEVGSGCRFEKNFEIQFSGSGGTSQLYIGEKCTFGSGRIIIEADSSVTSVTINRQCTFGDDLLIETGQGNKVVIGRDCMIDRSVSMFCCRRLSVYALSSGLESKDDIFTKCNIFIGDHTAVGTGCRIGKGTTTGSGSIINEYTHTDGHFPNNCLIAGEPAAVIKTDVCWSRKPDGTIEDCHFQYRRKTGELPFSCAGRRVLVISSGEPAGLVLTEELLRVGNTVTLCSTNDSVDIFGTAVRHLIVNAGSLSKVQTMLSKEYFDYVYDTAGLPPEQVSLLVSSVRCSMYILLSSTLVYSDASVSPITEDCFDPMHYQPVNGVDTMWELYRKRETAAFRCTAEKGIDILSVRVPHIVSEREVYLTAIKAAQRASEPGTLYHIKYPVVYVSQLAAFLLFAADSELRGTVNFSDKGIISEDILHKKLCEISMGSIDFTEANIFSSDAFSSMIDTGKAERAFFSVKNTEEWLLPMIEYYSELTLPYDIKYKLPLIK